MLQRAVKNYKFISNSVSCDFVYFSTRHICWTLFLFSHHLLAFHSNESVPERKARQIAQLKAPSKVSYLAVLMIVVVNHCSYSILLMCSLELWRWTPRFFILNFTIFVLTHRNHDNETRRPFLLYGFFSFFFRYSNIYVLAHRNYDIQVEQSQQRRRRDTMPLPMCSLFTATRNALEYLLYPTGLVGNGKQFFCICSTIFWCFLFCSACLFLRKDRGPTRLFL